MVLYHELTHAHHESHHDHAGADAENQTSGIADYGPGGAREERFSENRYRAERNGLTERGRVTDEALPDYYKDKYSEWESWWRDGQMKPRPKYTADRDPTWEEPEVDPLDQP